MAYIMIDQRIVDAQHTRIKQLEAECAAALKQVEVKDALWAGAAETATRYWSERDEARATVQLQAERIEQLEAECAANAAWITKLEDAANRLQDVFGADDMHPFSPAGMDVSLAPARLAEDWRNQRARIEQLEADWLTCAEALGKMSQAYSRACIDSEKSALAFAKLSAAHAAVVDERNLLASFAKLNEALKKAYTEADAADPTHEPGGLTPLSARDGGL